MAIPYPRATGLPPGRHLGYVTAMCRADGLVRGCGAPPDTPPLLLVFCYVLNLADTPETDVIIDDVGVINDPSGRSIMSDVGVINDPSIGGTRVVHGQQAAHVPKEAGARGLKPPRTAVPAILTPPAVV